MMIRKVSAMITGVFMVPGLLLKVRIAWMMVMGNKLVAEQKSNGKAK